MVTVLPSVAVLPVTQVIINPVAVAGIDGLIDFNLKTVRDFTSRKRPPGLRSHS